MARPLTRTQALENRAFLKLLRKTDNVRLACRELGLKYGTMQDRRRKHPGFALQWDAAQAFAQARFERVGKVGPSAARRKCSPLRPFTYQTDKKGRHGRFASRTSPREVLRGSPRDVRRVALRAH